VSKTLANVIIPTLIFPWGPLALLLLPAVIAVESAITSRVLQMDRRRVFKLTAVTNILSTVVGIPLVFVRVGESVEAELKRAGEWRALAGSLEHALVLGGDHADPKGSFTIGTIVLFAALAAASIVVEAAAMLLVTKGRSVGRVLLAVTLGNMLTYAMIALVGVTVLWGLS
jgi:hypothetical protein